MLIALSRGMPGSPSIRIVGAPSAALREKFFKAMQAEGVYTYGGYVPLNREKLFTLVDTKEYPWLEGINYKDMNFPVTEKLCTEEAVWLKQNHLLGTKNDTNDIIMAFKKVTTAMKEEPNLF